MRPDTAGNNLSDPDIVLGNKISSLKAMLCQTEPVREAHAVIQTASGPGNTLPPQTDSLGLIDNTSFWWQDLIP